MNAKGQFSARSEVTSTAAAMYLYNTFALATAEGKDFFNCIIKKYLLVQTIFIIFIFYTMYIGS